MSSQLEKIMMCPICLDTLTKPILQCTNGHNMCGNCILANSIQQCPTCRSSMTNTRCYQMEQMIEELQKSVKLNCYYSSKGCKFVLSQSEKEAHELECKFRKFSCEGKKFSNWKCEWSGQYDDIYKHFKDYHNNHTWMEFRTEANMKISFENDFSDVQIISFLNGKHFFYYKHKVDIEKEKAYWLFQFIGTKKQAENYYYEFEVHLGPVRKLKFTEICENDTVDANDLFAKEKCVVLSFLSIKSFLNRDGELPFKFRLMSIKKPTDKKR
ncbi:E3 ubiquitin-protein ligase SIAH1-like [Anoplophora glabripennis]|uniref:E3 ubiquitin-protein ligase SIAH1-like n=1 Tax=Anoplophora glabripennis TaxID=217634 RepID=UPI000874B2E4|nr:E3 ubiquitin-protein ligase SIAH1-like [Anoplophora glabripennis]XP_018567280.1 E3 ubiquitin-protein ligase SIAH1-like [Anoplophora glabripennis]XP_023312836.1 E3 ubiquitin-protein ligase SIAH1-like [Anoplophora glabripennis]XP_023312837.1 E3 ubiquitin-protein ligase SIAH1-like [Anoplophora glabripennis]